jgi:hypothetical protein
MKSWLRNLATVGALGLGAVLVSNCSNRTADRDTTSSRTDQTAPGYGGAGTQTSSDSKNPAAYPSQTPSTSDQTPTTTDPNTRTPDSMGSSSSTTGTPPSTYDTTGRSRTDLPPTTPPSDTTGSSTNPDTSSRPDRPRQ